MKRELKSDRKFYKSISALQIAIWLMVGIIASMSATAMQISGSKSLDCFYDVGKVYEITQNYLAILSNDIVADPAEPKIVSMQLNGKPVEWKFLSVDIDPMNQEAVKWGIEYLDVDANIIGTDEFELKEGKNVLQLNAPLFFRLVVHITDGQALEGFKGDLLYRVRSMQFRETMPVFDFVRFLKIVLVYFGLFAILSFLLMQLLWKRLILINWYTSIELLQKLFIKISDKLLPFSSKFSDKFVTKARIALFALLILYTTYMDPTRNIYIHTKNGNYTHHMFLCSMILLMIAVLSIRKKQQIICWEIPLVPAWFILWGFACISDFIIEKRQPYTGYSMIFVFGFLFFVWNNMEHPQELLHDFVKAIELSFVVNIVFCITCRPEVAYVYFGTAYNPNIFAIYLATVSIVLLGDIDHVLQKKKFDKKLFVYTSGFIIAQIFLWKTGCRSGVLGVAVAAFAFLFKNFMLCNRKEIKLNLMKCMLFIVVCVGPYAVGVDWGLTHIPQKLGTSIEFKYDIYKIPKEVGIFSELEVLAAAEDEAPNGIERIADKFRRVDSIQSFTSGRTYFYIQYMRSMNLWGHEDRPIVNGANGMPHNGLLAIAYRYGVFSAIPYLIICFYGIYYAYIYMRREQYNGKRYPFLPLGICIGTLTMAVTENIEQPFRWISWISLYFIMGMFFPANSRDKLQNNI
ncbi:hypothetical protein LQZ18_19535 [Lachnospiraceae bacterium ZAX-1]